MTRRSVLYSAAGLGAAESSSAQSPQKRAIYELRYLQLRNSSDMQMQRLSDFLKQTWIPAMDRSGAPALGVFTNFIAPNGPFLLTLTSFSSLAALETAMEKLGGDKQYLDGREQLNAQAGLSYSRIEVSLLRAFPSMPAVEVPPTDANRATRIFELRTYESNNFTTLARKIKMFGDGEIAIFRRNGITPVFFGETLYGHNMPNLTYMVTYDDLAARDKAWKAFGADPEWAKLRATPGLSDAEIVSNISNVILRPLPFSRIR
jgi:NIPSNAP